MRRVVVALLTGVLLFPVWVVLPIASAHCPAAQDMLVSGSGCLVQQGMEDVVDALNEAADGDLTFILAKDRRFHPEIATVRSGGTVVWLWGDLQSTGTDHDPRNTGRCVAAGADPLADPRSCRPGLQNIGAADGPKGCWDIQDDTNGNTLQLKGEKSEQAYPVTLRYDSAAGRIEKSHGLGAGSALGDATGAEPFEACDPAVIFAADEDRAVVPYHCGIHGGALTPDQSMRAVLIIEVG